MVFGDKNSDLFCYIKKSDFDDKNLDLFYYIFYKEWKDIF